MVKKIEIFDEINEINKINTIITFILSMNFLKIIYIQKLIIIIRVCYYIYSKKSNRFQ